MVAGGDQGDDNAFEADTQLSLTDDDDALPWLEGDEDEPEPASDYRILVFAAVAAVALLAILYGAWTYFSGDNRGSVTPDGSTIAAPEGAYKMRPENPGGQDVAGTGDLSFEVGEGQGREGRIAGGEPAPSIDVEQAAAATPAPAASATASTGAVAPARTTGVGVQVGAYSSRAAAEAGWNQLRGRYEALSGLGHRVIEGTADSGTIFRLQAVAGDLAAAEALCRTIRNAGGDCQVKR